MEELCGFTDGEHEIQKPKHMWTDDDSEPVDNGHGDTESHCNDACDLEQMSWKFVYSKTYERCA